MPEEQNNPFAEFGGEVIKKETNPFAEFGGELKKKDQPTRLGYSVTPLPSQDKFDIGEEVATIGYKSPIGKAIQKDKIKGSNVAGIYNTLVGSLASISGGFTYMADILGAQPYMPLNVRVATAEADRKKAVDFIEQARSSRSSKEFEQQQSEFDITPTEGGGLMSGVDWEDVRGLAFQAPKTLLEMAAGGMSGGLTFAQQSVNDNAKELEESGEGKKLTDVQKVGYLFAQAAAQAALEKFSIDKILKNTGLAKSIEKKITAEVIEGFAQKGIKATAKEVQDEMVKKAAKLSTKLKNVGIKGVESAFVEGSTEGIQQAASDAIKVATNKIAEKEVFNEEDINKNFWKNVVNNAVMGAAMGGATGAGLQGLNSTDKAIRQEIANATGEKKFYVDDKEVTEKEFSQSTGNKKVTTDLQNIQDQINKQVEEGNLTPEEAEAANITAQQYAEIAGKIPTTVSKEDKYKIIGGISQRNSLQQDLQKAREEMMEVDPIFRKEKQDQVDLIQAKIDETGDYLEGLATGKKPRYIKRDGRKGEETTYYKVDENGDSTPISQARYDLAKAIKKEDSRKKAPVDENRRRRVEQYDILYGVKSNNPEFDFPNTFEEFNKKIDSDPNYLSDLYKRAKKYKETGEIAEDEMGTEASFIEAINPPVEKDITIGEIVDKKGTYKNEKGTFLQEGDNIVFKNEASGEKYEVGNAAEIQEKPASEFDIKYDESLVAVDDKGNISVREKPYINRYSNPLKAINKDENGNVVSVNLETADGKKRTFKGSIAEDIAYQINLKEKSKEAPKVEPKAEQVVEKPVQVVKPVKPTEGISEIEKRQKQLEGVERINPNAGFPIFNVGQEYNDGNKYLVQNSTDKRTSQEAEGFTVISKIIEPAEVDNNGKMTKVAVIETTTFDSKEDAQKALQDNYNKYKTIAEERLAKAQAEAKPTEVVKPTKVEEIKAKIKFKLESFKERFAPVKKTSTKGEKIAEAKDVYKKLKEMDAPTDAEQIGLRYLADGGTVSQAVVDEIAGSTANARATLNTGRKVKTKSEETKARDYVAGDESLDDLAHRLWEANKQRVPEDKIKEALMEEIANNNTKFDAAKAYLERYSPEYTQQSYEDRMSEQMQAEEEEFRRKLEEEGLEEAPFAVREATTEDIESMQDIVADYVKDGVTALDDIKREIAKELGYNTKALRQIVEDAYNRYTTTTEVAPTEVLGAITDRIGNKMKQMFGKAAQAPVILNDANSMLDKAAELGADGAVIEFQKEQAKQQKGASVSDKTAMNDLRSKTEDKAKISIIDAAEKMITTLKSVLPNFDIVIHGSNESYNAAMKDAEIDGVVGGVGNFSYSKKKGEYSGRIDINLNRANNKTLAHEVAHGVMLKAFGDNPKLFKEFREKIASVLNESDNQTLIDFADRATYAKNDTYEEYLAELTAMLAEQETKLSTSTFQKIAAIINDIIEKITNGAFKPFEDIKKTKQVVDFFNDISESIRKGEAIKIENIKTAEELKKQSRLELENFERIATESIEDIARIFGMDLGSPVTSKAQVPVEKLPRPVINGFDVLKKKFGETAAKAIRSKIQIAINYPTEFIDFITAKIPIKEDVSFIVDKMGDNLDGLFRIAIQKNSEAADAKGKTPEELSKEAGYVFYKPKSNDDLIVFKKDFKEFEVLCTFNDPDRINNNVIFWLRRNNAETVLHAREVTQDYLREESEGAILWRNYLDKNGLKKDDGSYDLSHLVPEREDPYGTSSMSVQIGRTGRGGSGSLPIGKPSIKNRYNHKVDAPDETFDSNLDNIISGLEKAVYSIEGVPEKRKESGRQPSLPDYIHKDNQGRLFKYDQEINGVYISKNGYYDGNLHIIDKSTQKIVDDYLIDSKNKTATSISSTRSILTDINKISFDKNIIKIQSDKGSLNLELVDGMLKKISGDIERVESSFMFYNKSLTSIDLPLVKFIGNDFLYSNEILKSVNLPLVENIGDEFLNRNKFLENIDLPLVSIIGTQFLHRNESLKNINLPSTVIIGDEFLKYNNSLDNIDLPSAQMVGYNFLSNNEYLKSANLPNIRVISENFLSRNQSLKSINFPLLKKVQSNFLSRNENIEEVNLPLATEIGSGFLTNNKYLKKLNLPLVKSIESEFLPLNNLLEEINLPLVEKIGSEFLLYNESLTTISLPSVKNIGSRFMKSSVLTSINLPLVEGIDREFLEDNRRLESISLPYAELIGNDFLTRNQYIKSVELPLVKYVGNRFLSNARELINIKLPSVKIIGDKFLYVNKFLTNIDLPLVNSIGEDFLYNNESLSNIKLPLVKEIGSDFLHNNQSLTNLNLPLVESIGYNFIFENKSLAKVNLPSVINIKSSFLKYNEALTSIDLPLVESIGSQFLFFNESLENISLPNVQSIGNDFLYSGESFLKTLKLPNVKSIGSDFLHYNNFLTTLELPKVILIDDDFLFNNMSLENLELPSIKNLSPNGFLSKNKVLANKVLASLESTEVRSKAQMPMFMANQNGEDVLGFAYDNRMYLNGEKLNPNTIIHEAGHIWTEWVKNNDTKLYDKGMELVEKSPYLQKAKNSKFYKEQADKLATEEQREAYFKHEALAMAIGDKGAQFVLESKKESFQDWLKTLWTKIKNLTGFKDLTAEEFQNLTFDQFSKMAVKEILGTEGAVEKLNSIKSFRNKKKFIKDNLKYESNKNAIDELDFTEEDFIEIAKSNFDLSTFKNIKDAVQKRSTKKVFQPKQGEVGEAGGGRRRVEPRIEGEGITDEEGETAQPEGITQIPEEIQNVGLENQDIDYVRITKAELSKLRESLGLPAYKGLPIENREMLREAAQEMIKKGVSVESLYDKIRRGDALSNYENAFMAEYRAALDLELKNNPSQELLKKIAEFADIFQQGASLAGKALESLKIMKKLNEANTLSNFLLTRQDSKGYPLTPKMIVEETVKFEKIQKAKKELKESSDNDIEEQLKAEVEKESKKESKAKDKKSHEEFVKERKEALAAAREAIKKINKGGSGLFAVPAFGLPQLYAAAPHMNKYAKSLFTEGVSKLDDIVTEIHAEFSELIDGLTKRDVLDVISGKYNLKNRTANDISAGIRMLRREAELLNKLEQARLGQETAKSEEQVQEKGVRIKQLEDKIKEVKRLYKIKELAEEGVVEGSSLKDNLTDAEYNKKRQKFLDKKITELESDLKNKKYDKEAKETPKYTMSKKTKQKMEKVIELEKALALERYNEQYKKLNKWQKGWEMVKNITGIRRIVQTALDASIWFRQLAKLTLNYRNWDVAAKFIYAGSQSVFSQKNYDRLMYGIHQSPDFKDMLKDGIRFNELTSIESKNTNEFVNPKSIVFKIPIVRDLMISSQRIADASINVARYELYQKYEKVLLSKGITRESDPKLYQEMAKWVMNSTGSGNMLKSLESKTMQETVGTIFYGARLMAANFNTLNPVYYAKMPREVQQMVLKDMAAYTSTIIMSTLALAAAGGAVSMDPDDPEFLQVRFGKDVYDLTAGQAPYIRTFLRIMEAIGINIGASLGMTSKFEAAKARDFALSSTLRFFRNKLSPNYSYAANRLAGSNTIGEDFDPMEALEIYPMYADDVYKAVKEDGMISLLTVLMPNILGVGFSSYYADKNMKPMEEMIQRAQNSDELDPKSIREDITMSEFKEFAKLRDKLIEEKMKELYEEGIYDAEAGEYVPIKKSTPENITAAIMKAKSAATKEAKSEFNADEEE
jgi:hypothetical protein